jgi:uncharacterized membrane protein
VNWFALALSAGLASAANVWASKALLADDNNPVLVGGVVHLWGMLFCLLARPFVPWQMSLTPTVGMGILVMGLIYILANALYFSALRQTRLSEIDLFLKTSSLWTFVLGVVLLGEQSSGRAIIGAGCIVSSVLLLARQAQRIHLSRPQLLALAAALMFGAGNTADKWLSSAFDPLSYTTLNLGLTGAGMLMLARQNWGELTTPRLRGSTALLVGLTFALTQLLIILAFAAGGSAGEVILVAQVRLLILVGAGVLVLNEREQLGRKLVAVVVMLVGVVILYSN